MPFDFPPLLVPPNGLVVYCGTIVTEEGKEKKVNIDFEPFKPINTSLYLCDNKFHTEVRAIALVVCLCLCEIDCQRGSRGFIFSAFIHVLLGFLSHSPHCTSLTVTLLTKALTALLSDDSKFGFIVIDGSGALFGTLQGNTREVLHKFTVDLPKKHGTDPQYTHNTEPLTFSSTHQG